MDAARGIGLVGTGVTVLSELPVDHGGVRNPNRMNLANK